MGQVLGASLLSHGLHVVAYDKDPQRIAALYVEGANPVNRLADLAGCDVVISSLPNDDALTAVTLAPDGLVNSLGRGAIHISTSTVSPELCRRLRMAHEAREQLFVSATILGNPDLARVRRIFMLASGDLRAIDAVKPMLESLCQKLFVIGDDAGSASLFKLACNALTASTLQSMGEVIALLRKAGIDAHVAFDVITGTLFDGRVHKTYGGKIVDERYWPAGMVAPLAVKDLRLALAEAEGHAVPMPVASIVHDRLVALVAQGWGDLDWSALGALAARDAGLLVQVPAGTEAE